MSVLLFSQSVKGDGVRDGPDPASSVLNVVIAAQYTTCKEMDDRTEMFMVLKFELCDDK